MEIKAITMQIFFFHKFYNKAISTISDVLAKCKLSPSLLRSYNCDIDFETSNENLPRFNCNIFRVHREHLDQEEEQERRAIR